MLSETALNALGHIRYYSDLATSFVEGFDYQRFANDLRTFHAVTRCLEIISEASRRLPPEVKERHPHIKWGDMAAAGNRYRHQYEDIAEQIVWGTIHGSLPSLRHAVDAELRPYDR